MANAKGMTIDKGIARSWCQALTNYDFPCYTASVYEVASADRRVKAYACRQHLSKAVDYVMSHSDATVTVTT